jgi:hypothetical protein
MGVGYFDYMARFTDSDSRRVCVNYTQLICNLHVKLFVIHTGIWVLGILERFMLELYRLARTIVPLLKLAIRLNPVLWQLEALVLPVGYEW